MRSSTHVSVDSARYAMTKMSRRGGRLGAAKEGMGLRADGTDARRQTRRDPRHKQGLDPRDPGVRLGPGIWRRGNGGPWGNQGSWRDCPGRVSVR
jgi:hypothetical protein